ncbi:MAG: hypothetical protein PF689_05100 [Deltaproteobacteria bacterium]|jgi:hypothetical protein|nr:hypothetical protein [Deltaproteobacteria bacterium]
MLLTSLFLSAMLLPSAPKPQPFSAGTDLTIEMGYFDGMRYTPDGIRLGIGMLTQRQGKRRWNYEINYVDGKEYCHHNNDYCGDNWSIYGFGGVNYDFPISADRKFFASLTGGFFLGFSSYDQYYWYYDDDYYDDDDLVIMGGVMGKAALHYEFDSFRLGVGLMAGIGPSIGSESGLEMYNPFNLYFSFHWMF